MRAYDLDHQRKPHTHTNTHRHQFTHPSRLCERNVKIVCMIFRKLPRASEKWDDMIRLVWIVVISCLCQVKRFGISLRVLLISCFEILFSMIQA